MKTVFKTFVFILCTAFALSNLQAQTPMTKGVKVVQGGIGLGGWSGTYTSQTPILSGTFMMGVRDDLGPGNLSVGGSIGYKHAAWNAWSYNYTFISGRAAYHPHFINSDKIDVYGGLSLGIYHLNWDAGNSEYVNDLSATDVAWSLFVGGRYMFTENLGAYAELGYGLGWLNLGVAYQF